VLTPTFRYRPEIVAPAFDRCQGLDRPWPARHGPQADGAPRGRVDAGALRQPHHRTRAGTISSCARRRLRHPRDRQGSGRICQTPCS